MATIVKRATKGSPLTTTELDSNFENLNTDKLELSGGTMTGAITFAAGQTFDGRDVSADGSKLDGIESGADVTDTANVTAAGALMDSEVTNLAQVKAFDSTDYATAAQGTLAASAVQPGDNVSGLTNDSGFITGNQTITLSGDVTGSGTTSITATVANDSHSHTGSTLSGIAVSNLSAAAVQTSAEAFSDSDTVLMTAAAVADKIESYGYTTQVGDITGVTAGSYLTGGGTSGTVTVNVDATSANTASKVVARDASGNFSAGTITAALTGNVTGNVTGSSGSCTGNASTATTLQTARTIGGVSFNGSANINLPGVNIAGNQNTSGSSASCTGNAATATTLQTARTINGTSFNGSANITVEPYVEDDNTTNASRYVIFTDNSTGGYKRLNEDSSFYYNPSTNVLTAGSFYASSDRELKDNIENVSDALSKVNALNGVTFNWKKSGVPSAGVIAQDVEQILPELVGQSDAGFRVVQYDGLHAILIEAIKELSAKVDALESKEG